MNNIEYLIGSSNICLEPLPPFADVICDFLADFSSELTRYSRQFPDIASLAFWCRKANIQKCKNTLTNSNYRLGRGVCFHIAPSNIPVNFAFSWLFSLVAGNSNIVRLPSRKFMQTDVICEVLRKILPSHLEIAKRTVFVRYPVNDDITASFCAIADVRMIWGGDNTVTLVKALPSKPRCIDIAFPDRYSFCLLNGRAIREATDHELVGIAESFYNDTYLIDQNACSSPQLVAWLDVKESDKERFWNAVYEYTNRHYSLQDAVSVDKYTKMCEDAINLQQSNSVKHIGNLIYRVQLTHMFKGIDEFRGICGYFYEYSLNDLNELVSIVTDKYQTLTYMGFDGDELRKFVVQKQLRGIDRIVPLGKALDIDITWDGFELVTILSRVINSR